jgi:catecholate siderophore receptor
LEYQPTIRLPCHFVGGLRFDRQTAVLRPFSCRNRRHVRRVRGIPHHLFNANINYQFDFGLGFSLGAEVTSPINVTYGGSVKIPTQFTLNAGVFYQWKNCEIRLDLLNLTKQKNWATVSTSNGSDLIYPEMPFQVQGTLKIRF